LRRWDLYSSLAAEPAYPGALIPARGRWRFPTAGLLPTAGSCFPPRGWAAFLPRGGCFPTAGAAFLTAGAAFLLGATRGGFHGAPVGAGGRRGSASLGMAAKDGPGSGSRMSRSMIWLSCARPRSVVVRANHLFEQPAFDEAGTAGAVGGPEPARLGGGGPADASWFAAAHPRRGGREAEPGRMQEEGSSRSSSTSLREGDEIPEEPHPRGRLPCPTSRAALSWAFSATVLCSRSACMSEELRGGARDDDSAVSAPLWRAPGYSRECLDCQSR
jgi:hypothetical protein